MSEPNAVRSNSWSSTTRTRIVTVPFPLQGDGDAHIEVLQGDLDVHAEAAAATLGEERTAEGADPFAHACDPMGRCRAGRSDLSRRDLSAPASPLSTTSIAVSGAEMARSTMAWARACFTTFVSASWMIRYTESSSAGES